MQQRSESFGDDDDDFYQLENEDSDSESLVVSEALCNHAFRRMTLKEEVEKKQREKEERKAINKYTEEENRIVSKKRKYYSPGLLSRTQNETKRKEEVSRFEYPLLVFDASMAIQLFTNEERKTINSIEKLREAIEGKIFEDPLIPFDTYIENLMEAQVCMHSTTKLIEGLLSYTLAKMKRLNVEREPEDYFHIYYPLLVKDTDVTQQKNNETSDDSIGDNNHKTNNKNNNINIGKQFSPVRSLWNTVEATTPWPVINKIKKLIQHTSRSLQWKVAISRELVKLATTETIYLEKEEEEHFEKMYENWSTERVYYIQRLKDLQQLYKEQLLGYGIYVNKQQEQHGSAQERGKMTTDINDNNNSSNSSSSASSLHGIGVSSSSEKERKRERDSGDGESTFIISELMEKYNKISELLTFFTETKTLPEKSIVAMNESTASTERVTETTENDEEKTVLDRNSVNNKDFDEIESNRLNDSDNNDTIQKEREENMMSSSKKEKKEREKKKEKGKGKKKNKEKEKEKEKNTEKEKEIEKEKGKKDNGKKKKKKEKKRKSKSSSKNNVTATHPYFSTVTVTDSQEIEEDFHQEEDVIDQYSSYSSDYSSSEEESQDWHGQGSVMYRQHIVDALQLIKKDTYNRQSSQTPDDYYDNEYEYCNEVYYDNDESDKEDNNYQWNEHGNENGEDKLSPIRKGKEREKEKENGKGNGKGRGRGKGNGRGEEVWGGDQQQEQNKEKSKGKDWDAKKSDSYSVLDQILAMVLSRFALCYAPNYIDLLLSTKTTKTITATTTTNTITASSFPKLTKEEATDFQSSFDVDALHLSWCGAVMEEIKKEWIQQFGRLPPPAQL